MVAQPSKPIDSTLRTASHRTEQPGETRLLVNGVTWGGYCAVRELLDSPGIRMYFHSGVLEIMTPSQRHESLKSTIARLLELYAVQRDIPLQAFGSTTFRKEAKDRGAEPDECYCIGRTLGEAPDFAIEVALTSGGLDKLNIYAGLGVREVWFWRDDRFELFALAGEAYQPTPRSALLPDLDLEDLATYVRMPDQHLAVKAFWQTLKTAG